MKIIIIISNTKILLKMNIINPQYKAFTLVELIVVITILSVLSTIWFLSFQWYGVSSRDAVRLTDMRMIEKWLSLLVSKSEPVPLPDNKIDITASGTILRYQWYAWTGTLWNLWVNGWWKNPLDNSFYTYTTNAWRNKYQLLGFFESQWNISYSNHTIFANLSDRFLVFTGDNIWIAIDTNTKQPLQDTNTSRDIYIDTTGYSFIMDSNLIEISADFSQIIGYDQPHTSCNDIKQEHEDVIKDGFYLITNSNKEKIKVYCKMENEQKAWTKVLNYTGDSFPLDVNLWETDWFLNEDNYSYLYSFKNMKSWNKYEYHLKSIKPSTIRDLHLKQTNAFSEDPNGNQYERIGWNLNQRYINVAPWFWLGLWEFWNPRMQTNCVLSSSYGDTNSTQRWTCLIDKHLNGFWTWPYDSAWDNAYQVEIWQR